VHIEEPTRRSLVWETRFVMLAFLFPGVVSAVVIFVRNVLNVGAPSPFTTLVPGNPLLNFALGIPSYLGIAVVVPIALLLLSRTGVSAKSIGLAIPGWWSDIWPGVGLVLASYGTELLLAIPFAPLLNSHPRVASPVNVGHVPAYYVVYGIVVSATTAITEETLVNGYLLVRLEQLGWTSRSALVLSLTLRTSYHLYYGLAFLFTIPFGYYMTRSFQKHRRLTRPIVAHFLNDATLFTIAVLTS
jgi:membrane protease YdiL (CAAX protease family)